MQTINYYICGSYLRTIRKNTMKKVLFTLGLIAACFVLYAQDATESGPQMKFETPVIDYGTIEDKADGQREFVFTNTGDAPLIISQARGSCGCTVPTYSDEPIAPGATGKIGVKYDTNRIGKFTKTITLTTNTAQKNKILTIKGEVLKPSEVPNAPSKPKTSPLELN